MKKNIAIRDEIVSDVPSISELTRTCFETLEISKHTEHFILQALREAGALSVSLVAVSPESIVGHIAFSPVEVSDGTTNWFGLGPMAVLPKYQRQGIGKALVRAGLARLQETGAGGCCLVGHPEYYPQLGFENPDNLYVDDVPAEVFFVRRLAGRMPEGRVTFHEAFSATS